MSNGLSELRGQSVWNAVSEADKAYQDLAKIVQAALTPSEADGKAPQGIDGASAAVDQKRAKISILAAVETYVNAATKERLLREKV